MKILWDYFPSLESYTISNRACEGLWGKQGRVWVLQIMENYFPNGECAYGISKVLGMNPCGDSHFHRGRGVSSWLGKISWENEHAASKLRCSFYSFNRKINKRLDCKALSCVRCCTSLWTVKRPSSILERNAVIYRRPAQKHHSAKECFDA